MFHTRPGKSYKALNPKCYVHGRTATHPQTDSTDILKRTFSSVEATINKSSTDDGDKDVVNNIVILPFPFNVLGGVPYYEEIGARFSHRPFFNGSAKEVVIITCPLILNQFYLFNFQLFKILTAMSSFLSGCYVSRKLGCKVRISA